MKTFLVLFVAVFAVAVEGRGSFERFGPERFGPERGGFGGGFGGFPFFQRCPPCPAGQYLPAGAACGACVSCTVASPTCVAPKAWNPTTCSCGCPAPATPCTMYQKLDQTTCACVCYFQNCPWPPFTAINAATCQC